MVILTDESLSAIKLVLIDIDGTLLTGDSENIENVVRQLRRLKPVGVRFSIATGRTLHGAQQVIKDFLGVGMRMPPVIAYNGAIVACPDDKAIIHRNMIPPEACKSVLITCHVHSIVPLLYVCRKGFDLAPLEQVYGKNNAFFHPESDFNGMPINWAERLDTLQLDDVAAVLGYCSLEKYRLAIDIFVNQLGELVRVTSSGPPYIEIAARESTKSKSMEILAHQYRLKPNEIMAIGDSYNDMEMLANAGIGVAVANAPDDVKAASDYVCERKASEGVVEALRMMLDAIRRHRIRQKITMDRNGDGDRS